MKNCPVIESRNRSFFMRLEKSSSLIFEIKKEVDEVETIIRIPEGKIATFNGRVRFMKKNNVSINLFDLAGQSKRRLQVWRGGKRIAKV